MDWLLKLLRVKKIDGYIFKQFMTTFFFMVLMVIVIIIVIDVAEKTDDFIEKKAPLHAIVFDYYFNFVPYLLILLSPICVFLGVIYFTARLTQQSEVVAILSSGVSFYRLMAPYMVTALILGSLIFYLEGFVVPHATKSYTRFEDVYLKGQQQQVVEERNIHKKIGPISFLYLFTYNQADKTGTLLTLETISKGHLLKKMDAQYMRWVDSTRRWRLTQIRTREFLSDGRQRLYQRPSLDTNLRITPDDIHKHENQAQGLTMPELAHYINIEKERGSDFIKELQLEEYSRYAYPFAALILTGMGVALSTKKRRGGIGLQLGLGMILAFAYVLILTTAKVAIGDAFPAWVAVWLPNMLFLALGIVLIRAAPK